MDRQIDGPIPLPCDFVVKNGRCAPSFLDQYRPRVLSAATERVRTSACAITSPMTLTRAMNSSGHSRVERNAPKPTVATTRPPTSSGTRSWERMPIRR